MDGRKSLALVMEKMKFSKVFIDWILLFHKGATTRLLFSFISDPISILFSVRQGDCLAMILFIIYIEPLMMVLGKYIQGYLFKSPSLGGLRNIQQIFLNQALENYVDDMECILTSDTEFLIVDNIVRNFEQLRSCFSNPRFF